MSHEESGQSSPNGRPAGGVGSAADPEVTPKAERRRFTAGYKLQILAEADACTKPGEIGALLRRENERLQQRLQQAETTPHLRSVQVSSRRKKNSQRCSA